MLAALIALVATLTIGPTAFAADPVESPAPSASSSADPTVTDSGPAAPDSSGGVHLDAPPTSTTTWFTNLSTTGTRGIAQYFGVGISPAPDGGTVSLKDNTVVVDTKTLGPGDGATNFFWTPATTGTHHVQAVFSGTSAFAGSSSPVSDIEIANPAPDSVTIQASANPVARNATVTYTVTVTPNPGGGSIEWRDASPDVLATTALDVNGQAQYATSYATTGSHPIYAKFTGTADWSPRFSDYFYEQVSGDTVALTLDVPENPMPAGNVVVTATVTPIPGAGTVRFQVQYGPTVEVPVDENGHAVADLGAFTAPQYVPVTAEFLGNETYGHASANLDVSLWKSATVPLSTNRTTAVVGELPVVLTSNLAEWTSLANEKVTWVDDVGGNVVLLGPVAVNPYNGAASFSTSGLRVGVHTIHALYHPGDNAWTFDATSAPVTITVSADTAVHATFKVSASTFYPYKDGFRDTVSLGGVLDERASASIKIYSSTGSLKRTLTIATRNAGPYSITWNGRTSTGVAVAAGKYKVVAVVKDTHGHSRTFTTYTTVSWRKAVWKSVSVLRYASTGAYYAGNYGGDLYYSNDYPNGRILDSGSMIRDCEQCGWIGGKFVFSMASTALDYRSIFVQVRGHGFSDREHTGATSVVNPTTGALIGDNGNCEFDDPNVVCGLPISKAYVSSTKKLETWVWMTQAWGDAYDLYYLRLTYQYAVWAS